MKLKNIAALLMALVLGASLGGCSKKDTGTSEAKAMLETARKNLENVKSYDGQMNLSFKFENEDGEKEAKVITDIISFKEPELKNIKIEADLEGQEKKTSEFYVNENNQIKSIYTFFDNEWYTSEVDDETLFYTLGHFEMQDVINTFIVAATGAKISETEEINGAKTTKIDAVIDEDLIANTLIYTGIFAAAGMGAISPEHLKGAKAMAISFNIDEDNNLVSFSFDAGAAYQTISDNVFARVQGQSGYEDAKKLIINKYAINFVMSNINEGERFVIPAEVLNAKSIDTEIMPQLEEAVKN